MPEAVRAEIARTKLRFPSFWLRKVRDFLSRFQGVRVSTGTVARATVADAYGRLVAGGYAEGRRGGGTTVAPVDAASAPSSPDVAVIQPTSRVASLDRYGSRPHGDRSL